MQTLFLVEDDENIRELVRYALTGSGFLVKAFEEGASFLVAMAQELPELVLLDIMLPGQDGFSLLGALKRDPRFASVPVILLTAKGSEMDRVKGLDLGADDYITKPFSVLELTARVKALLRRVQPKADHFTLGGLMLDLPRRAVLVRGEAVQLTFKEFELLAYLFQNQGLVLTREQILRHVWGYDYEGESRTVDMHIMALRQKLGSEGHLIKTLRSVGYKLGDSA